MLKTFRYVFASITLLLVGYVIVMKDNDFTSYIMLFFGLTILIMGVEEFQKNRVIAILCILTAVLHFSVGIYIV